MKKFLSLVLALIMVMSLVTVGAGAADFSDAEAITPEYAEAVEVMNALEILKGYNGAFDPQGNLTRGAAAKIIAVISLGVEDAADLSSTNMSFTDVSKTSSVAPHIAWCAEQGIINGTTDDGTKFEPKEYVSGHAFLKMLLGALCVEGQFTGTNWRINVAAAATTAGLFAAVDEDEIAWRENITRELAAQLAFTAMGIDRGNGASGYMLDGEKFTTRSEAVLYANLAGIDAEPTPYSIPGGVMAEVNFGLKSETGVITTNSASADTKLTTIDDDKKFAVETGLEQLGNTVTVWYTEEGYTASKGYTVFAVTDECTEITITSDDDADDVKAIFKAAGITTNAKASKDDAARVNTQGKVTTKDLSVTLGTTTGKEMVESFFSSAIDSMTLIINDGAVVGAKAPLSYSLQVVTDIEDETDKETITLSSAGEKENGKKSGTTKVDIVNEYEGIAKNDVVIVTKIGDIYNLAKAETVTGKITKIVDDTTITVGGTAYELAGTYSEDTKTALATNLVYVATSLDFETEYTLYLDGKGGYIAATTKGKATDSDYVYVIEVYMIEGEEETVVDEYGQTTTEATHDTYWAQCVNMAGEEVKYQIKKGTYGSGGKVYDLAKVTVAEDVDNNNKVGDEALEAEYATFDYNATAIQENADITVKATAIKIADNQYFTDDVKFIYVDQNKSLSKLKVTVKEGVQALTNASVDYVIAGSGTNKTVAAVFVNAAYTTGTVTVEDVVYAAEADKSSVAVPYVKSGETKTGYEHTVYIDGVKTTIVTTSDAALTGFIKLTKVVDGVYSTAANNDDNVIASTTVKNMYQGKITINGVTKEDIDVTGVTVVDLKNTGDKVITDATKLTKDTKVAVVLDKAKTEATNTVVTIYVIK